MSDDWFWTQLAATQHGCREWSRHRNKAGYGIVKRAAFRDWAAHRVAWTLRYGPIPDSLRVLHHCDNPPCCEPTHLFLGTDGDNLRDMRAKGRHPQVGDNHWARKNPERTVATRARAREFQVRGEDHPNAKLTADQILEIRRRYADGNVSMPTLAAEFGLRTWQTVYRIVHRVTWRHV